MIDSLRLMIFIACVSSQNLVAQDSIDHIKSNVEDKTPSSIQYDTISTPTLSQGDTSLSIKSKISNPSRAKNKNRRKHVPQAQQVETSGNKSENDIAHRSVVLFLLGALIVIIYFFIRFLIAKILENQDKTRFPDFILRTILTRKSYYNEIYLKSEAWNRKRAVVLKRDQWVCIYCKGQATEVHHLKYARKIGN